MSESKTSKRRLTAAERRKQAVKLRIGGATYDDISEALGISKSNAYYAVMTALKQTKLETAESVEELRQIEKTRLERLILAAMPQAQNGNLKAIDTVRRLSESLRKLYGLDSPDKIEFNWREEVKKQGVDPNELYKQFEDIAKDAISKSD